MSDSYADLRSAMSSLRSGDAAQARSLFARALEAGAPGAVALLGMAHACRALGDEQGKVAALDRLLAAEPRNVRALLMKAGHLAAQGYGVEAPADLRRPRGVQPVHSGDVPSSA